MAHKVVFSEQAWHDTDEIYDWIAGKSDPEIAENYISRIIEHCEALRDFPNRGTSREGLSAGLRTISFERKATIAYEVEEQAVLILRVLHHGRDLGKAFVP